MAAYVSSVDFMASSPQDEQFYRFLTLSNERIAHFMISRTTNMEKYFANPSVSHQLLCVVLHCNFTPAASK